MSRIAPVCTIDIINPHNSYDQAMMENNLQIPSQNFPLLESIQPNEILDINMGLKRVIIFESIKSIILFKKYK